MLCTGNVLLYAVYDSMTETIYLRDVITLGSVISFIDKLRFSVLHYPFFMIVNTHAHKFPSEHWISVYW